MGVGLCGRHDAIGDQDDKRCCQRSRIGVPLGEQVRDGRVDCFEEAHNCVLAVVAAEWEANRALSFEVDGKRLLLLYRAGVANADNGRMVEIPVTGIRCPRIRNRWD